MKIRNFLTKTLVAVFFLTVNFLFADLGQEVSFDTTEVNNTIEQVITLSNTGDLPLVINALTLHSDDNSFTLTADSSYTIDAGEEVDVKINFQPETAGEHSASLFIESNDEENAKVTLTLTGYAEATTAVDDFGNVPVEFGLDQNYPNPFNPTTNINYQLAQTGTVKITVFNMLGEKVATLANEHQEAGYHQVKWNATNDFGQQVSSGVYFLRMQSNDFVKTMSMTFTK